MQPLTVRCAARDDVTPMRAALQALSRDLGDPHRAGVEALRQSLFGPCPAVRAQVAGPATDLCGLVLFSPVFSTVGGGAGAYVSDLWVAPAARGHGLGTALLRAAAAHAAALWGCAFLRLAVHDDNPRARALYSGLGFEPSGGATVMVLAGDAFQDLRGTG
jgi:ribosomal protein S18 acetylase RimI-like enzyme